MSITPEDNQRMRVHFKGLWRGQDAATVWDSAYRSFCRRYETTISLEEFKQLCGLFGNSIQDVGGGGDRPHAYRLSIGSGG